MNEAAVDQLPGEAGSGAVRDLALLRRHGRALFQVTSSCIEHGIESARPLDVDPRAYAAELRAHRATFVTLRLKGDLRGCVGTAEAWREMVVDVANNAYRAAFGDRRFLPLKAEERLDLDVSISLLSPPEPMRFRDEPELLAQLRPGIDGLIIADGERRALFLPSVWETLPEPRRFLKRLKRKAGLAEKRSLPGLKASRFVAVSIGQGEFKGAS